MYKLFNGDALDVLRGKPEGTVQAIITDPPYGVDFQSRRVDVEVRRPKIANDKRPFIWWLYDAYRVLTDPGVLLCFTRWDVQDVFRVAIEAAGFEVKAQLVWDKVVHGTGDLKGQPGPRHELIWYATKGRFLFPGDRPMTVVQVQKVHAAHMVHPNQKPVELLEKLINGYTRPGDIVLDPFMGSGSAGVAAMRTGRRFIGIELDPDHYTRASRLIDQAYLAETLVPGNVEHETAPSDCSV